AEADLCRTVTEGVGGCVLNLAGRTSLTELAAVLSCCSLALTNDSGGMHLATALGIPVVAVFGVTDPCRTGPLGVRVRVLQDSARCDRDLGRHLEHAAAALARITPARAAEAALELAAADVSAPQP
ncbi:MAG: glycosyltransferase family 9 protein, partial [Lentisphaerae bacterium]|nr:glycosyltransferase family 9 protein [Lentisphaerota bacterium]